MVGPPRTCVPMEETARSLYSLPSSVPGSIPVEQERAVLVLGGRWENKLN